MQQLVSLPRKLPLLLLAALSGFATDAAPQDMQPQTYDLNAVAPVAPPRLTAAQVFLQAWDNYNAGEYQLALDRFSNGLAEEPGRIEAWQYLGLSQAALGQDDQARSSYNRALSLASARLAEQKSALAGTNQLLAEVNAALALITPLKLTWLSPLRLAIAPDAVQAMEQNPALRVGRNGTGYTLRIEDQSFEAQAAGQCTVAVPTSESGKGVTSLVVTTSQGVIDPPFVYGTGTQLGNSCLKKDTWSIAGDAAYFSIHGLLADTQRTSQTWSCSAKKCRTQVPASKATSLDLDQFTLTKALGSLVPGQEFQSTYAGASTLGGSRSPISGSVRCTFKAAVDPRQYQLSIPGKLKEFECTRSEAGSAGTPFKMLFSDVLQVDLYALGIRSDPADTSVRILRTEGKLGAPGDKLTVTSTRMESVSKWINRTITIEQPAASNES